MSVSIELKTGLEQRADNLGAIEELHADDLREIDTLTVTVRPSRTDWRADYEARLARSREAEATGFEEPTLIDAEVEIRIWRSNGLRLSVRGPDRTNVEGLGQRLTTLLRRSAGWAAGDDFFPVLMLIGLSGFLFGALVPRWLDYHVNPGFTQAEFVGVCIGLPLSIALAVGLYRAFPRIEILDEGGVRTRMLPRVVVGIASTLLLGVIASGLYDALS